MTQEDLKKLLLTPDLKQNKKLSQRLDKLHQASLLLSKTNTSFNTDWAKKTKRKVVDNSGAKDMMKEYHLKTHFKAAMVYTMKPTEDERKNENNIEDISKNREHSVSGNSFLRTPDISRAGSSNLINKNKTATNFFPNKQKLLYNDRFSKTPATYKTNRTNLQLVQKFSKKFALEEENLDIIEANPLLYNLNFNPLRKQITDEETDKDKLEYLKRLAYNKDLHDSPKAKKKGVKFLMNLKGGKRRRSAYMNDPLGFFNNFAVVEGETQGEIKMCKFKIILF